MAPGTPTGESYYGVLMEIGKRLAFIDCKPVKAQYNDDVFVPSAVVQGFSVGDKVHFDLLLSERGQPQAGNVRRSPGVRHVGGSTKESYGGQGGGGGKGTSTATGKSYFGTIMEVGKRFAFIDCPPVRAQYNDDVFCPTSRLQGFSVGQTVDFDLMVSDKGQPQASNVRANGCGKGGRNGAKAWGKGSGAAPSWPPSDSTATGETFEGTISDIGKKLAFIDCEPVKAQHNDDVFIPSSAVVGFSVGDEVSFDLLLSAKGQPQAANLRRAGEEPKPAGGSDRGGQKWAPKNATGESHSGRVTEIGRNFAFIECEAAKAQYGDDVFCPSAVLRGFKVGDEVQFDLMLSDKGQPQAANIQRSGEGKSQAQRYTPY